MIKLSERLFFYGEEALSEVLKTSYPIYMIILVVVITTTTYVKEHPVIIAVMAFILLIRLVSQCIIKKHSFFGESDENLPNNKYLTFILRYSAVIVWSVFTVVTMNLYRFQWPGILVLLITFGIASGATIIATTKYSVSRNCIAIVLVPVCGWCLFSGERQFFSVSILIIVYLAVLMKIIKEYNKWYQTNRINLELLNSRTSELIRINEELQSEVQYRRATEKALRKSEERYRILFQNNPIETIIVDHNAKITVYNSAKAKSKGRVPDINDVMYKDYGGKHKNNMYDELIECIRTGKQKEFPEQQYNNRFLHIKMSPFSGGAIITSIDITKRKLAEQQIQTLTRDIMRVQENERKRIARDLHDSVAQDLSSLRISCETFFDDTVDGSFQIRKKIKDISKVLHNSIQAVREIAYELRPPSLDEFGLAVTLFRYCEEFSTKTGIDVDFFAAGIETVTIDSDTEINLYRLVQEALANIKKHSGARNVKIRLVASYPDLILRIEDNGDGFDASLQVSVSNKTQHMGLRSMEERVSLLRGHMNIKSRPGEGTSLLARVPVNFKSEEQVTDLATQVAN